MPSINPIKAISPGKESEAEQAHHEHDHAFLVVSEHKFMNAECTEENCQHTRQDSLVLTFGAQLLIGFLGAFGEIRGYRLGIFLEFFGSFVNVLGNVLGLIFDLLGCLLGSLFGLGYHLVYFLLRLRNPFLLQS